MTHDANEQYDLFEILEREDSEERGRRAIREGYRKWLKAPELTPCGKRPVIDYCVHDAIIHRCETMPENVYMWQNPVAISHGGEYWCRQTKGLLQGEQMDLCPYCRADLHAGEGRRYLRRATGYVYSQKSYRRYYGLDEVEET